MGGRGGVGGFFLVRAAGKTGAEIIHDGLLGDGNVVFTYSTADLPANDSGFIPDGASWGQVKVLGKDGRGFNITPYSKIVSVRMVP